MTKKQEKKLNSWGFIGIFFVVILIIFILGNQGGNGGTSVSKPTYTPKPNVHVGDSKWEMLIGLSKGYYGLVNGVVVNSGDATANDVRIECYVKRDGRVIGSEDRYLGSLSAGQSQLFEMEVDFSGSKESNGYCTATCSNC